MRLPRKGSLITAMVNADDCVVRRSTRIGFVWRIEFAIVTCRAPFEYIASSVITSAFVKSGETPL